MTDKNERPTIDEPPISDGDTKPVEFVAKQPEQEQPPAKPVREPEPDTIPPDGRWYFRSASDVRKGYWLKHEGRELRVMKVRTNRGTFLLAFYCTSADGKKMSVGYFPGERVEIMNPKGQGIYNG